MTVRIVCFACGHVLHRYLMLKHDHRYTLRLRGFSKCPRCGDDELRVEIMP